MSRVLLLKVDNWLWSTAVGHQQVHLSIYNSFISCTSYVGTCQTLGDQQILLVFWLHLNQPKKGTMKNTVHTHMNVSLTQRSSVVWEIKGQTVPATPSTGELSSITAGAIAAVALHLYV